MKEGKKPHIVTLMLLSAFAAMGAVLMTPALPKISSFFGVSMGLSQLTVTSFLLGYSAGQLLYGPLANRFGRKLALFVGIILATLGSLFSILASPIESFPLLITGRFLEAVGASGGLAVSYTIINDFYPTDIVRRITGFIMIAFSVVPGAGIAIGGLLTQFIGWEACFYFLLIYGFLLVIPICRLPETLLERDRKALHFKNVVANYKRVFLNKHLVGYSLCSGFSSSGVYVFGAVGPFIGIYLLHFQPSTYGILGLLPFFGTFIGSLVIIRLSKINAQFVLKLAFFLELFSAVIMFILFLFNIISLITLFVPMAFFFMGHSLLSTTAISLAMRKTHDKANGAAVVNFSSMAMPVCMTFLLGIAHIKAAFFMPLIFLIALFLMASIYITMLKNSFQT